MISVRLGLEIETIAMAITNASCNPARVYSLLAIVNVPKGVRAPKFTVRLLTWGRRPTSSRTGGLHASHRLPAEKA